jgi:F-box-like
MRDSRLPRELIDAVIDHLHEDSGDLLACSLVCREWLPSSQRHLFRRVTFTLDEDRCEGLAQALLRSLHLADYIRELKVRVTTNWRAKDKAHLGTEQSLPAVLRKLSKLRSIELRNLDVDSLPVDLRQSLRWVLLLPSLTSLRLHCAHNGTRDFVSLECHAECIMGSP